MEIPQSEELHNMGVLRKTKPLNVEIYSSTDFLHCIQENREDRRALTVIKEQHLQKRRASSFASPDLSYISLRLLSSSIGKSMRIYLLKIQFSFYLPVCSPNRFEIKVFLFFQLIFNFLRYFLAPLFLMN